MSRARGNITRRGQSSWQLKFDDARGVKRRTRYVTVRGTRRDAQKELTRLLGQADAGTLVNSGKITVQKHIEGWLDSGRQIDGRRALAPKTVERYRELANNQIFPHLGATTLQKLKLDKIEEWHTTLLKTGGKNGKPLAARTVGHAHRVLHGALELAMRKELVGRNVASIINPPAVDDEEVEILTPDQVLTV